MNQGVTFNGHLSRFFVSATLYIQDMLPPPTIFVIYNIYFVNISLSID